MPDFDVDVSELNRLSVDLGQAGQKVGDGVRVALRKAALDTEAQAKAFAPVDTGNLRNSIGHSDLRALSQTGTLEVEVGPTAAYGRYVEEGTSRAAPQAFMGPAFDRVQPGFLSALDEIAEKLL